MGIYSNRNIAHLLRGLQDKRLKINLKKVFKMLNFIFKINGN